MIIALTVAQYVCQDMNNRSAFFADRAAAIMIARLLQALGTNEAAVSVDDDEWVELLDGRVKHDLRRLETVGVLTSTPQGEFVVRAALRGAVARGVVTAMAILSGEFETD